MGEASRKKRATAAAKKRAVGAGARASARAAVGKGTGLGRLNVDEHGQLLPSGRLGSGEGAQASTAGSPAAREAAAVQVAEPPERSAPSSTLGGHEGLLESLRASQEQLREAAGAVAASVAACRSFGVSWQRIGQVLGLTGEGARKRFGADVEGPPSTS